MVTRLASLAVLAGFSQTWAVTLPIPTPAQAAWHDMEIGALVHFGMNTFTDREWGDGKEDPKLFNPSQFDARQWVTALKAGGVKILILTVKHHDGFCLWPSQQTSHSVTNSPWRDGTGDVVREVADACRAGGLQFGVYLSPWDRHEPSYGDLPRYNEFFRNQLRELLTNYGPVAEVWFDGACGEGPNGKKQQYDWESYYSLIRRLQPQALIAINGPDIRWAGNEQGLARENESSVQLRNNQRVWYPAECDVSIRPGWFYHARQNDKVKSAGQLLDLYTKSVGRNAVLLINVPPDQRGLIHEQDAQTLAAFGTAVQRRFGQSLAETSGTGNDLLLSLTNSATIDRAILMEDIRQGERVDRFVVEGLGNTSTNWQELAKGQIIGHKRILEFPPVEVAHVRLRLLKSAAPPIIRRFAVFSAFPLPKAP